MDEEYQYPQYSGGTSDADFESNLSNTAPTEDWFSNTYGANGMDSYYSGQAPQESYAPFDPTFGLQQNEFQTMAPPSWDSFQYQGDPTFGLRENQFQTLAPDQWNAFEPTNPTQSGTDWAGMLKGGTDFLGKLFTNGTGGYGGSGGSTNTFLKGLAGLLAAQQEKKSNQQMSQQIPQTVNSVRQFAAPYDVSSTGAGMMQPGATTMRDAAQQQAALANQRLQNFRNNPNSDAGYKATNDQIEQVLNRQAAMHGNRNNFNATAPAMLAAKAAAQLKYDQNYQQDLNSWDVRSGANISPVQAGGLEALMRGQQYGAQGNSPYYDALGKILNTNSYENNPQIQELLQAIKGR